MKARLLWFAAGLAAVLIAQEAADVWAERFTNWTAIRDADSPARNAVHLRQQATITNARAFQTNIWVVPRNRRLALEQIAIYCVYPNIPAGRLEQAHLATVVNNTPARFPMVRNFTEAVTDILASPVHQYADAGTPVQVTLGFTDFTNALCEISATGYTIQLGP